MWEAIIKRVLSLPPGVSLTVSKIGLPKEAKPSIGEATIFGFGKDWEITLEDGKRIHIVELENCYLVHWDKISPLEDPLGHLMKDAPHWYEAVKAILLLIKNRFF